MPINPNDTESNLSRTSEDFRNREIARNTYSNTDEYRGTHPNSISDGDEKGKGEGANGSVGSRTDIQQRQTLKAKNKYSFNNPYNINNA